jgi:hypothetical protein
MLICELGVVMSICELGWLCRSASWDGYGICGLGWLRNLRVGIVMSIGPCDVGQWQQCGPA